MILDMSNFLRHPVSHHLLMVKPTNLGYASSCRHGHFQVKELVKTLKRLHW